MKQPFSSHSYGRLLLGLGPVFLASATAGLGAPTLAAVQLQSTQSNPALAPGFFENRIAPVLAESCVQCHSSVEGKTKGGLALDTREGLMAGGDNGPVVLKEALEKSPLLQRLHSTDPEEKMPPKEAKLSKQQVEDLSAWIKAGAPDPRTAPTLAARGGQTSSAKSHWAFQPVQTPSLPAVQMKGWCKTPLDRFILASLEKEGLKPNLETDRATLIRRATFDMVGIPPTPAEVQAFVDDKSPGAWEKVVDRLLASPQYGERWGRYWLDLARYSDTKGTVSRKKNEDPRNVDAWSYRDYVIRSFNEDLPYDRFVREQLAADLYAKGDDRKSLPAMGFLTVGEHFGGNANDVINDQIDVVTKGFLGLTVSCARCHDHMFDPVPQKDYYSLHGIFKSSFEPKEAPVVEMRGSQAQYEDYLKSREALVGKIRNQVSAEYVRLRGQFRKTVDVILLSSKLEQRERAVALRKAGLDNKRDFEGLRGVGAVLRSEPTFLPFFALSKLSNAEWSTVAPALIDSIIAGSGRFEKVPMSVRAAFADAPPETLQQAAALYSELFAELSRREAAAADPESAADPMVEELGPIPFRGEDFNSLSADALAEKLGRQAAGMLAGTRAQLDKLDLSHPGAPRRAMVMADSASPSDSPVLIRGEVGSKGAIVPRRFLEILSPGARPEFRAGSGRKELAEAIVDRGNPLTARVFVNRVWQNHFGNGIVGTPDDFGTQSPKPTHPELLDYLASQFMANGWHMKPLHREILLSAVYRQSSVLNQVAAAKDPANGLLWRFNLRRLDFEAFRDSLLFIAGRLDLSEVGGQPVNILSEPFSDRRSVYGYVDRAAVPELMTHFDFANPGASSGRRHETIVPQQALYLMNSPLMVDVSRRLLARPEMQKAHSDSEKVEALYWMAYQRAPKPNEVRMSLAYLEQVRAIVTSAPEVAAPAVSPSDSQKRVAGKKKANEAAAQYRLSGGFQLQNPGEIVERKPLGEWEKLAHALLMANEMVYCN